MGPLEKISQNILEELQKGHRGQIELDHETKEYILQALTDKNNVDELQRPLTQKDLYWHLLCILDHSLSPLPELSFDLISILQENIHAQNMPFLLGVLIKHTIEGYQKNSSPPPPELFNKLEELLHIKKFTQDPESFEWLLRTIEALGPKSLRFRNDILELRPQGVQKYWGGQKKCHQLILFLENYWQKFLPN